METQSKFAENVEHIQKNFETLDQRLAAIKKWSLIYNIFVNYFLFVEFVF